MTLHSRGPDGRGEDGSAVSSVKLYLLLLLRVLPNDIQAIIVIKAAIVSNLIDVRNAFKPFMYINSFNLLNNPMNQILLTFHFSYEETRYAEVKQLITQKAEVLTWTI